MRFLLLPHIQKLKECIHYLFSTCYAQGNLVGAVLNKDDKDTVLF